eukprot:CAMPEP_0113314650 /NCGR_PEP_ID=MMETSP0010_2-20120614/10623_1 /TAXON_ID=216773 ORGANISM="Corethron hystrix, Strain 308" /NCGR_SAMPLE_ID=MMETSP0010_2 /ASSEMBLY_ACC=CAM_ASM_000155 /LENGTH=321 /DNA_ID=CAMNT_0000170973 /DNA_START=92 /DNA_END=1057 /DNA_ORIENTATION=- /assembly_acc=CAM_ASM_000155
MRITSLTLLCVCGVTSAYRQNAAAFVAHRSGSSTRSTSNTPLYGKLDDLTEFLNTPTLETIPEEELAENNQMAKDEIDRYGPGNLNDFVEFDEYDGGDGQTGCVGDGKGKLEQIGSDTQATIIQPVSARVKTTSRERSATNAWGTSTGYADQLREQGVETARAQQLENYANQQELNKARIRNVFETEEMDKVSAHDDDWRQLSKFGGERTEDFDFDSEFGPVSAGEEIKEVISLKSILNKVNTYEIKLKNPFMGFADYRAAMTPDTPKDWTVSPNEGAITNKEDITFVIKFKPQNPGTTEGYLVIQTEDFKYTYKLIGTTG